jgi:hypothetical protein
MTKHKLSFAIVFLASILCTGVIADKGPVNKFGAHHNQITGEYHSHVKPKKVKVPKYSRARKTGLIQSSLKILGYYNGKIDHKLGPQTVRAIKKFQKDNSIRPTGKMTKKTQKKLFKKIEKISLK